MWTNSSRHRVSEKIKHNATGSIGADKDRKGARVEKRVVWRCKGSARFTRKAGLKRGHSEDLKGGVDHLEWGKG